MMQLLPLVITSPLPNGHEIIAAIVSQT